MCSGGLKQQLGLGRRAGWSPGGEAQMGADFLNHRGVFDCSDHGQGAATLWASTHDELENPFEKLSPFEAGLC